MITSVPVIFTTTEETRTKFQSVLVFFTTIKRSFVIHNDFRITEVNGQMNKKFILTDVVRKIFTRDCHVLTEECRYHIPMEKGSYHMPMEKSRYRALIRWDYCRALTDGGCYV